MASAGVYTATGDEPPAEVEGWHFRGLMTRTTFELVFPPSASAGTVWITAKRNNPRGEAADPRRVNLPAVEVAPEAGALKMAA